jgi:CRISPR system Cascade subunit CasB
MTDIVVASETNLPPIRQERDIGFESQFIEHLRTICKDTGMAAALRRNAGTTLAEARNAMWFYRCLATWHVNEREEEQFFLVATLFALDKSAHEAAGEFQGDFGATLRILDKKYYGKNEQKESPLDRRFNILLDADFDPMTGGELAFRLRQMVKLVTSKRDPQVRINWPILLADIRRWNHGRKWVQKKWARSYYAPISDEKGTLPTGSGSGEDQLEDKGEK